MISITKSALQRFRELVDDGQGVRLYSTGNVCGPSISIDIADRPEQNDGTVMQDGLTFFIEREAAGLLKEITIDYIDKRGFVITGLSTSSCCG